ncbi:MAG: DUF2256 domain-containing protein [Gluconobacter cerinus]|uniref:DUF2256 domain-containing protein n=1 Tax=Gluconobacter cerinus TaxID=38307 RepID=UPI0039E8B445
MARGKGKIERRPAKQDLPSKVCPACDSPFTWRKKWAKSRSQVQNCAEAYKGG